MKFLIFGTQLTSIFNFRGKLLEEIQCKGYEIHILTGKTDNLELIEKCENLDYKLHFIELERTGLNPLKDALSLFLIYRKVNHIKPNLMLNFTIKPVMYGTFAAFLSNVKKRYSLITGLGYLFTSNSKNNNFLKKTIYFFYKFSLNLNNKVIFQNYDDRDYLLKLAFIKNIENTAIVNGSGVDLSFYSYDLTILENYSSDKPIKFLMLGRVIGDKGVREYIAAAKNLKNKYGHKVIFQLAGGLDINPTAIKKEELNEWINTGIIEYLGKLKDVRPAIINSHVFVLPSYREGTSRSILEAMSIGRPIVTTNVAGCRQLVDVGNNGYLAEAKSVQSLVDAIEKMINLSSNELIQMGAYSRKIVEDKYDVHKVNEHMLTIMDIK